MSRPPRTSRIALLAAGLFLGFGLLSAPPSSAADDDFDYAQALAARGYADLAELQFRAILGDSGRSAAEKAEGQYGLALLKRRTALIASLETSERRRKPLKEVLELFAQADTELAQFLSRNPKHPRALDAKLDRAKLLTERADYVNLAIASDWVPSDVTEESLRAEVADNYDTAIDLLKTVEDSIRSRLGRFQPGTLDYETTENELGIVWLHRIQALVGKGEALPGGNTSGVAALNQALSEIDEFMWLYDGTVRGLFAFYFSGRAQHMLGDEAAAVRDTRDACSALREADGVPAARGIVMLSHESLGKIALAQGGEWPGQALETFDKLEAAWPSFLDGRQGQLAALMYARLMADSGRASEAIELVQDVIRKAKEGATGADFQAGQVLGDLLAGGSSGAALDPALLRQIALSTWRDSDFRGAIRAYQSVVSACRTPEQMEEFGWDAWQRIGVCYGLEGRFYEAYLAYDRIERAWAKDRGNDVLSELTNETTFRAAGAIDAEAKGTKDAAKKKELFAFSKKLLADFAENHPDSPYNQQAELRTALELIAEGKRLIRNGEAAAGMAKLEAGEKKLREVKSDSAQIEKVTAILIELRFIRKQYDEAIAAATTWLEKKREGGNATVKRARASGRATVLKVLLQSHVKKQELLTDPAAKKTACTALLAALDKYGEAFAQNVQRGDRLVVLWRAEGLIGTGQITKADELVARIIAENPNAPNGPFLAAKVAQAREIEAKEWLRKGDRGRYQNLMVRAAKLSEYAVLKSAEMRNQPPSPAALLKIGNLWREAGDLEKAEHFLRRAQEAYAAAGEADRARAVRVDLINLLVDQKKYEQAIPELESLLVADPADRKMILTRLGKDDNLTNVEVKEYLDTGKMTRNKRVLSALSRAYVEAERNEQDLLRCINLCGLLQFSHKKDNKHNAEWVEYVLRMVEAYFKFGSKYGSPDALRRVKNIVQNTIMTMDLLERYDEVLPGSKRRFEFALSEAKSKLGE